MGDWFLLFPSLPLLQDGSMYLSVGAWALLIYPPIDGSLVGWLPSHLLLLEERYLLGTMNLPINGWLTTGPTARPNDHAALPSTALQGSSARLPVQWPPLLPP
ncbi:hypothetical protein BDQ94DRAFT_145686 [Aspergillus welwitschiae]|uniref:Uncharacterized protein n=1 Tax=Aspergillus welwitschiae TaxID=1341132 RepID=A0A3F3PZM5_9EURO|nr:hypothetical protein BDQ94DRAFT_145686 [Aspergillus welwitschiae]RDH32237.1 hypothetical protein BDQ94DRAFT_145686 [Aspergillus welwitschiae]